MTQTTKDLLIKVPAITLGFWIIKILCTTVGETAADFLNVNLNFGLTGTSVAVGIVLAITLFFQFQSSKYIPSIYWLTVALISVFGTLVTDDLTDKLGVSLEISTILFGALLALTFLMWYLKEKTLSIHSIFSTRREVFYWLVIFLTFALGTASGDLLAEALHLGYLVTGLLIFAIISFTAIAWRLRLNSILSFWVIYIMTRPLGASIGDFLSQPSSHGGLGLGSAVTSLIFLTSIFGIVTYLSLTKKDVITDRVGERADESKETNGLWHTVAFISLFLIASYTGYNYLNNKIEVSKPTNAAISAQTTFASPLGDLSNFKTITQDTLDKLDAGDQAGATARIADLEYAWDQARSTLYAKDKVEWKRVDGKIDTALRELRALNPNITNEKSALESLLSVL